MEAVDADANHRRSHPHIQREVPSNSENRIGPQGRLANSWLRARLAGGSSGIENYHTYKIDGASGGSPAPAAPVEGEMAASSRDPRLEAFSETLESLDAGSTMRVQGAPRDPAFDAAALGAPSAEDQQSVIDVAQRVFPDTCQLTKKKSLKDSYLIIRHFLSCIIHEDGDMVPWYRRDYGEMVDVRLMVSHMMDLGPVYDQPADGVSLLDFESEQVRRMAKRQATPDSGLIYFEAYSPYREHWPQGDSGPGRALAIVENAVLQHCAYGIKLYPPSGYRPCHNEIPEKPRTWFTKEPGIQWSARYTDGSGNKLTGSRL